GKELEATVHIAGCGKSKCEPGQPVPPAAHQTPLQRVRPRDPVPYRQVSIIVLKRYEERAETLDIVLVIRIAESDQAVPGFEGSPDTAAQSRAVALVLRVVDRLDVRRISVRQMLRHLIGVIACTPVVHNNNCEGAAQAFEISDDTWQQRTQVR